MSKNLNGVPKGAGRVCVLMRSTVLVMFKRSLDLVNLRISLWRLSPQRVVGRVAVKFRFQYRDCWKYFSSLSSKRK